MHISVKWFGDQFNVSLHSNAQADEFFTLKGCRIKEGSNGKFVSVPSSKMQSGKYWNHAWLSEKFAQAVLEKAEEARPQENRKQGRQDDPFGDDLPF